jgi:hypothetical protein
MKRDFMCGIRFSCKPNSCRVAANRPADRPSIKPSGGRMQDRRTTDIMGFNVRDGYPVGEPQY